MWMIDSTRLSTRLTDWPGIGTSASAHSAPIVIVGSGAYHRKLGVPGESLRGVVGAVDLLRRVGEGQEIPVPQTAVVIGGGNVAIDVARTAARLGSSEVHMMCLEKRRVDRMLWTRGRGRCRRLAIRPKGLHRDCT